jgi:hypothetical protein
MDWKQRMKLEHEKLLLNIKNVAGVLHGLGIISAEQHYGGGGDSGQYGIPVVVTGTEDDPVRWIASTEVGGEPEGEQDQDDVNLEKYAWPPVKVAIWTYDYVNQCYSDTMMDLDKALVFVLEKAIEIEHSGWENNDGGMGCATMDTATSVIDLHHGDYVQSVEWTDSCIGDPPLEPEEVPTDESTDLAEGEE